MTSFVSLELRWFFGGKPSTRLSEWFSDGLPGPKPEQAENPDEIHLYQPQCHEFGITLRRKNTEAPYNMEINWRESAKPFSGPHGAVGHVERWHKWRWDGPRGPIHEDIKAFDFPRGPWIKVEKLRWRRKYTFERDAFVPVGDDKFPKVGAAVELARLKLHGESYTTVLVESFSPNRRQQETVLTKAMEQLWIHYPDPRPGQDRSYGYPFWLARYAEGTLPPVVRPAVEV